MAASQNLVMPKLGLTMTEGLLAEWRVEPRQRVRRGDILFVVETEKIANEVEASAEGTIEEILVPAGEVVPVGAVLAHWTSAAAGPIDAQPPAVEAAHTAPPLAAEQGKAARPATLLARKSDGRVLATPLARRLARQVGIDLHEVSGSGPRGRIKAQDVRAAKTQSAKAEKALSGLPSAGGERRLASSYETTVARRLTAAKRDVPHFYVVSEADVGAMLALRGELNDDKGRERISINHMLLVAVARALAKTPEANRVWRDGEIEQFASVDIGIAVDTERGLIVPMLRDLAGVPLDIVARRAAALIEQTRRGELSLDDTSGGAITISNVGMHHVTYLAPIINPGQAAILGVGSVRDVFRPNADGQPVLRREMGLVLACDHRVLDGVRAAALLNRITSYLETPLRLLRAPDDR